tara:strand:- start:451 stop:2274 length:1824 start_codon:yes stop_codon:yes gene_type:complete
MSYQDSRGFTDTQDNQKDFNEKYMDSDAGPYLATVKTTADPLRMGRLGVNVPALSNTTEPTPEQLIWCQYLSPFYGVKSLRAVSKTNPYDFKATQQSYGMWAVPPDIDTTVMVIFAKGDQNSNTAFWIGCVQDPMTNQMVPANGATDKTRLDAGGVDFSQNKQAIYGTDVVPAGEKNRKITNGDNIGNSQLWNYPVNNLLADQLTGQGLIQDTVRGTTSSSARRESPSAVFGMNTPGRIRSDSRPINIGLDASVVRVDRESGHSFVMDDGDVNGDNQLTRLRTASGHQLLMHDTDGVVYLANGSGKAFIEMASDGTISVYSANGIDFRSGTDFNLHSDTNINFHAKGNINFTAEQNVQLNAEANVHTMAKNSIRNSSQGTLRSYAGSVISSFSEGTQLHGAGGNIDLAGSQVHLNSQGPRKGWGPSWLVPEAGQVGIKVTNGLIDIDDDRPFRGPKSSGVDKFGNDIMERGLQVNKIPNKTTVSDFVTHEPYDRNSSTARKKKFINEAIEEIRKSNPDMSASDIQQIKTELLKQKSVKAVAGKLKKIVNLNDKIKIPLEKVNTLVSKASEIQRLIDDPKAAAMNFVYGKIASIKTQAISAVRSFFRF